VRIGAHIQADLHALLDHELDVAARSEVLGHLDTCRPCQEEYEAHRQLKALLAEHLVEGPAPPWLWQVIVQQIEEDARGRSRARGRWRRAVRFAGLRTAAMVFSVLVVAVVAVVASESGRLTNPAALTASLIDEIVRDHRASVVAASGPADVRGSDFIAVLTQLQTHGRLPESTPALPKEAGQLLGGSFCRFKPTTGIRLTYRLDEGQLASLYQLRRSPAVVVPPSTVHRRYLEVLED
jgi:anti-sigma factor RsiW